MRFKELISANSAGEKFSGTLDMLKYLSDFLKFPQSHCKKAGAKKQHLVTVGKDGSSAFSFQFLTQALKTIL